MRFPSRVWAWTAALQGRVVGSVLSFAFVLLLAGPPWAPVRRGFASVYSATMNGVFGQLTFGKGGHLRLSAGDRAPDGRKLEGDVTSDTVMLMTIDGYRGSAIHGLNARRDAYLPLVVLLAAGAAAPLAFRAKLRVLLIAGLIEIGVIFASMWLFIVWDFGVGLGVPGVYDLSPAVRGGLDLAFRTLLLPPGNRFVIPLVIIAFLAWTSLRPSSAQALAAKPSAAPGRSGGLAGL